jgi:protein phosphatase methylesterase 1
MMNILAARPASFPSPEEAVAWAVRSGVSRNKEAAAVSIPSQLVERPGEGPPQWTWRTPLQLSRPYWEGWYMGLSEAFLQVRRLAQSSKNIPYPQEGSGRGRAEVGSPGFVQR